MKNVPDGKMTNEALAARRPRMALARTSGGFLKIFDNEWKVPQDATIIARSFTKQYLEKIRKANL